MGTSEAPADSWFRRGPIERVEQVVEAPSVAFASATVMQGAELPGYVMRPCPAESAASQAPTTAGMAPGSGPDTNPGWERLHRWDPESGAWVCCVCGGDAAKAAKAVAAAWARPVIQP